MWVTSSTSRPDFRLTNPSIEERHAASPGDTIVNQQVQLSTRTMKVPGPDQPIEIEANPRFVVVLLAQ
jgi:hypothetical protein